MQRFVVAPAVLETEPLVLEGPVARQIAQVLRMRPGNHLVVLDGVSTEVECSILTVSPQRVTLQRLQRLTGQRESTVVVHLYPALLRAPRFDFVLQKATELGVASITPVICRRSIASPPPNGVRERWRSIVREAAEQSGRTRVPTVHACVTFSEACARSTRAALAVICSEIEGEDLRRFFHSAPPGSVAAISGPEGGLEGEEIAEATAAGLRAVTLGPRILRAETAALAVCAAVSCLAGEWSRA